jgi:hypothetical protein
VIVQAKLEDVHLCLETKVRDPESENGGTVPVSVAARNTSCSSLKLTPLATFRREQLEGIRIHISGRSTQVQEPVPTSFRFLLLSTPLELLLVSTTSHKTIYSRFSFFE